MTWVGWAISLPPFFVGWAAIIVGWRALRVARQVREQAERKWAKAEAVLQLNEGFMSELDGHPQGPDDPIGRRI